MLDQYAQAVFAFATDLRSPFRRAQTNCPKCGIRLESYYCENKLYIVRCRCCTHIAMVVADSAEQATAKVAKLADTMEAAE